MLPQAFVRRDAFIKASRKWRAGPEGVKSGNVVIAVIAIVFRVISRNVYSREKERDERDEREGVRGLPKRRGSSLYLNAEIESARAHGIRDGITGLSAHMHSAYRSCNPSCARARCHEACPSLQWCAREGREQCTDVGKHENTRIG